MKLFTKEDLLLKFFYLGALVLLAFVLIEINLIYVVFVPVLFISAGYIFHYIRYNRITKSRLLYLVLLQLVLLSYSYLTITRTPVRIGLDVLIVMFAYVFTLASGYRMYLNDHLMKRSIYFYLSFTFIQISSLIFIFYLAKIHQNVLVEIQDYLWKSPKAIPVEEGKWVLQTLFDTWTKLFWITLIVSITSLSAKLLKRRA